MKAVKAIAKCPGCGHKIATSESVESFSGKNWSSDFLVVKEAFSLDWTIDVENVEVVWAPQQNEEWFSAKTGQFGYKQKAHLHRWKVQDVKPAEEKPDSDGNSADDDEKYDAIVDKPKSRRTKADKEFIAAYRKKRRSGK
jgi:hypothetical protein